MNSQEWTQWKLVCTVLSSCKFDQMAISIHTVFDVRFMFWISIDQEFYQGNVVKVCETIDSKKFNFQVMREMN